MSDTTIFATVLLLGAMACGAMGAPHTGPVILLGICMIVWDLLS